MKTEFNQNSENSGPKEEVIDFSRIKEKTLGFFKNLKTEKKEAEKEKEEKENKAREDEISFDFKKIITFTKKNSKWLIPLIFILIAIFISTYLRTIPLSLPITDNWAENTVHSFYRNQLEAQISQQYPHLPDQNQGILAETVEKEFQKFLENNQEQIKKDIGLASRQYKANLQDEQGNTYLLTDDPYLWYSQARNVLRHGHLGDKIIDGESYFSLRDGRLDKKTTFQLHPYVCAYFYKLLHLFDRNISLMKAMFLLPVVLIGLSLIPLFFIGRKIAGNVGGFFAAVFMAINFVLLNRTFAGFADTDAYNVLFPLLAAWLILEACTLQKNYLSYGFSILAGLITGIHALFWGGWIFFFLTLSATIVATFILKLIISFIKNHYKMNNQLLKENNFKKHFLIFIGFLASSVASVSLSLQSFKVVIEDALGISVWTGKSYLEAFWPKVQISVVEFEIIPFSKLVSLFGGYLLFAFALIGIFLTLLKKNKENQENKRELIYFVLLTIWTAGALYSFTKGGRFALLLVPPFALALGSAFGLAYEKASRWLSENMQLRENAAKILIFLILVLFLISPLSMVKDSANGAVPLMNDVWYNALTKIKADSQDAIITSWWDFGHLFVAIAERRVTFDGGDQKRRIHWVGKALLTDDETEAIGILRMLNCGQETASRKLDEFTGDGLKSIQILEEVLPLKDREKVEQKYLESGLNEEQAKEMLEYTHCEDIIPNYFITSGDMVYKAGTWGHFGSWDFEKATIYQNVRGSAMKKAVEYLRTNFNKSEGEAEQIYYEIQTDEKNNWIATWPGYSFDQRPCQNISKSELRCSNLMEGREITIRINLRDFNTSVENFPNRIVNSIVYAAENKVEEKKFPGDEAGFSVLLIPAGENNYLNVFANPLQATSIFTMLFFFEGRGLNCFSKFDDARQITGERIITWKIDFDCRQENRIENKIKT